MTSFGLCKVFHYKYDPIGHNFTGRYYVLPSQEIEQSCICVLGELLFPLSALFLLDLGTVPTVWHFLFKIHFIIKLIMCYKILQYIKWCIF